MRDEWDLQAKPHAAMSLPDPHPREGEQFLGHFVPALTLLKRQALPGSPVCFGASTPPLGGALGGDTQLYPLLWQYTGIPLLPHLHGHLQPLGAALPSLQLGFLC